MKRRTAFVLLAAAVAAALAILPPRLEAEEKAAPAPTASALDTYRARDALRARIAAQQKEIAKLE